MLGRRGPVQAAFTPPELQGARRARRRRADRRSRATSSSTRRARRSSRPTASVRAATSTCCTSTPRASREGKPRRIVLRFLVSPIAILGEERVEAVEVVRNELVEEDGRIVARPTGETEVIPCGLVLRSVGYKGVPLPGVPFDERSGMIPNERGRVVGGERTYAAGWIKRGPSGVIGTNKKDATETVELLLDDARAGQLHATGAGRPRRAARREGRRLRRLRGLAGDRRCRACRGRAAGSPEGEADGVGGSAANRGEDHSVGGRREASRPAVFGTHGRVLELRQAARGPGARVPALLVRRLGVRRGARRDAAPPPARARLDRPPHSHRELT